MFASALVRITPRKISLVKYIPVEICHVGLSSLVLLVFSFTFFQDLKQIFLLRMRIKKKFTV